jgi:hypothetical protein
MSSDREKLATEMECLYRLIKSHSSVSIQDIMRLSGLSQKRVRYHLSFFRWYGVANNSEMEEQNTSKEDFFMVTNANIEFVEGSFPTVSDFFFNACVEIFSWNGDD